jgi:micrococcal nuclease
MRLRRDSPSRRPIARPRAYGRRPARHAPGPERMLKRVMALGVIGLLLLPLAGDLTLGIGRPMAAPDGECRVLRVIDGDTADLFCGARVERARLLGYDSPELFGPSCPSELAAAVAAKWALRRLIWQATDLSVVFEGRDRYDRRLARLRLDGRDVAAMMVEAGHGRAYGGGLREAWCG